MNVFYLRKFEISYASEFSILAHILKSKTWKNIYNACKFQGMCFTWGSWKFPMFTSYRFWPLNWDRKLGKLANFVLSEFVLFEEVTNFKGQKQPPEVFCKKVKKFYKFHLKTPVLENTRPQECNFVKKETLTEVFSCEIEKFLRTPFLKNTSGQLLL